MIETVRLYGDISIHMGGYRGGGRIASRWRSAWPSVKYVDDEDMTRLMELSESAHDTCRTCICVFSLFKRAWSAI